MRSSVALCERVQANCDIADARHAGSLTMCVYLMKMREYFRWEMGLDFGVSLPGDAVGKWIQDRERHWETLEDETYQPLKIQGRNYDPFDADAINQALQEDGYVYSAGLGTHGVPHFFLARLEDQQERDHCRIYETQEECARDLTAPPAMSRGRTIFVRRESLRRMLWERLQEWRWDRRENALGEALACYPFEEDLEGALDAMTRREAHTAILHEIGEIEVGRELGEDWHKLLHALPRGPVELGLRAMRDHWADCQVTLPALLEAGDRPALLFYRASLTAMRRRLYPALNEALARWRECDDVQFLQDAIARGQEHWGTTVPRLMRQGLKSTDPVSTLTPELEAEIL